MKVVHIAASVTLGIIACLIFFIHSAETSGISSSFLFSVDLEWMNVQKLDAEVDWLSNTVDALEAKVLELERELEKWMVTPSLA